MEKKPAALPARNKERSKQRLLDAVGKLLKSKGYPALKVNDIATTAGLDKKLIYKYFGGVDQLIDEYIHAQDFWSNVTYDEETDIADGGLAFTKRMLHAQFEYVHKNKAFQKLILWGLSEQRKSLKQLADDQEANGALLFEQITDPYFGNQSRQFRAISAILVAGLYHLNLYPAANGSMFCGIDLKKKEDRAEIQNALSFLLEQTYKELPETSSKDNNL
ncbi:MAG: TetR family transcriptional regulator [Bacteroidetes bacterium 43-16]|nr:MAG: TetR family transcriptional regulator [Bacteroidetes bacterium 43-16]